MDPGCNALIDAALAWLCRAQDCSRSGDGGVARDYSLLHGWAASYPETTGYIVPTMLHLGDMRRDGALIGRARRMLDWLVTIQLPCGGYQGGVVGQSPVVPVAFNTGQILIGLAAGARRWPQAYGPAMDRAAGWLVDVQDTDGSWSSAPSPFVRPGLTTYDTHVAWGLLEAARVVRAPRYVASARDNIEWALSHQRGNGWFDHCCLGDSERPLTHTIAYALRGVIEAHAFLREPAYLEAARRTADALAAVIKRHGYLPGRLDADWRPAVEWSCLTGTAQVAHCLLLLYRETGSRHYRDAGCRANAFVRRTVNLAGGDDVRGGIKGSFPVTAGYGAYQYLNWAAKFSIDANLLEADLHWEQSHGVSGHPRTVLQSV